jgi:hypothetical protein
VQQCWHTHWAPPPKVTGAGSTPSCCTCRIVPHCFSLCSHFTRPNIITFQVTTPRGGSLLNTVQASSMLPHWVYMSTRLPCRKTSESHPLSTICRWAHLPSSSARTLAHTFSTPTKVTGVGHTPSCCICQNSSSAFCPFLHVTYPNVITFQVTTTQHGSLLNTVWASSILPYLVYMLIRLLLTKIFKSHPCWTITAHEQTYLLQALLN